MHIGLTKKKTNYPQKPKTNLTSSVQFPTDLIAEGRNFYSEFIFMDYDINQQFTKTPIVRPSNEGKFGSIWLPLPRRINDIQTVSWGEISGTGMLNAGLQGSMGGNYQAGLAASVQRFTSGALRAGGGVLNVGGTVLGMTVNPMLFMSFQQPNYKEHSFEWILAPSSEMETRSLKTILDKFRYYMLPEQIAGGAVLKYPSIVFVKLYPEDEFTMKIRPCAVMNAQINHTGAGQPSFFKNGAPTVVTLSLQLREIQLWDKTNFDGSAGVGLDDLWEGIKEFKDQAIDVVSDARDAARTKLGTK